MQNPPSKSISQALYPRSSSRSTASSGLFLEGTRAGPKRIVPMVTSLAAVPSGRVRMVRSMPRRPTRIDLLELDIDVRLADLWREANEIEEWNLEVMGAFIRAAYGKGYCDALTEDDPGSLCVEHGYRIPERQAPAPVEERERARAPRHL